MARLIEFFIIIGLAYWLYQKWRIQTNSSQETQSIVEPDHLIKMVQCEACKVRIPLSDSLTFDGRYFCDNAHLHQMSEEGWFGFAYKIPSPNFNKRPNLPIDTLVVHHISLPVGKFGSPDIKDFFCNRLDVEQDPYFREIAHLQVSAHFLIDRQGQLTQFVSCHDRAWHAGLSQLFERTQCNDFSIGIELEGTGELPFELIQYARLAELIDLLKKYFPIQYIVGHSDIAPGRKSDPGPSFDWKILQNLSHLPIDQLPFGLESR